ncbi:MAG: penicillin-binding transpeptidase domain-containing protein [Candidatus Competibacteraceae bacterium]
MLDVNTANSGNGHQPAANPNDRSQRKSSLLRVIAVTDVYEPGSTLKPFTIVMLESGRIPTDNIDQY